MAEKSIVWRSAREQAYDARHRREEAHIQHAVGLIQHHAFNVAEIDIVPRHMVEQAARAGDDDFRAVAQRVLLRHHAHAAVDSGGTQWWYG